MSDKTVLVVGLCVGVLLLSRRGQAAQNVMRYGQPVLNQNPDLWWKQGSFRFLSDVLKQPLQSGLSNLFKGIGGSSSGGGIVSAVTSGADGLSGSVGGLSDLFEGATGLNDFGEAVLAYA